MRGGLRRRRFLTDSEQFPAKQRKNNEFGASMDSDAEEAVHTVNADVPLDSVLVCFPVRCLSFVSVVPHWHRGHVTVESSVRHCAAVDLERSGV